VLSVLKTRCFGSVASSTKQRVLSTDSTDGSDTPVVGIAKDQLIRQCPKH